MKTAETVETAETAQTAEVDFFKSWMEKEGYEFNNFPVEDLMAAYLAAELKNRVNAITDTAIKLEFSRSRCNHIHPDRFKEQGALWLKDEILKHLDHAKG